MMPSAEARNPKSPKFREYKEGQVHLAEKLAEKLGVKANYAKNVQIANVSNHALFTAHEKGLPMPQRIEVKAAFTEADGENPKELAYYLPTGKTTGEIYLNAKIKAWHSLAEAMKHGRERNFFSTADPRHLVMHELGERAWHLSMGQGRIDPLSDGYKTDERAFRKLDLDEIKEAVSSRAAVNHGEFVAEVYTGLLLGRDDLRQDTEIMEAFERFGGKKLLEWTK
jgi:hypothetical protein